MVSTPVATERPVRLHSFWRYLLALLCISLALLLRWTQGPVIGVDAAWLFIAPVIVAVMAAFGLGPGFLACLLGAVVGEIWLVEPVGQFRLGASGWMRFGIFFTTSLVLGYIGYHLRQFHHRAGAAAARVLETRDALRRSEAELRSLLAAMTDVVLVLDAQGSYVKIAPTNPSRLYRPAPELLGKTLHEVFPAEFADWWMRHIHQALETRQPVPLEYDLLIGGQTFWFAGILSPLSDDQVMLVARDITEQKKTENALRQSQLALRTMIDAMPEVTLLLDPQGIIIACNDTWPRRLGMTIQDVIGRRVHDLLPPAVAAYRGRFAQQVVDTGRPVRFEDERDGRSFDTHMYPVVEPGGPVTAIVVLALDITERKRAEDALRESAQRLARAQEIAHLGSWELDLTSNTLTWSDEVYRIFGLRREEFAATYGAFLEQVHPDDRAAVDAAYQGSLREGRDSYEIEHRVVRKATGEVRWVQEKCQHLRDEQGRTIRSLGMVLDITERRRAEDALRDLNASLERRVEARTVEVRRLAESLRALAADLTQAEQRERKRIATILHDHIQQLLVAARMHVGSIRCSLSKDDLEVVAQADEHIAEAITASRSLTAELSPPVLHEAGLAAGLGWLAERMREQHHVEVKLLTEGTVEPRDEDVRLFLFDAVRELLFNVHKYAGVNAACVTMTREAGRWIKVVVEDRGKGFDPESLKQQQRPATGGFGLFSIQQRLAGIGGRMEIESAPGTGTHVTLYAPMSEADVLETVAAVAGESAGAGARVGREGGRIRLMVVDDHRVVREGLRNTLEREPDLLIVGEAEDGEQAIERAGDLHPDAILMDVTLPRLDGIGATQAIHRAMPQIKVIGLSMHDDATIRKSMLEAGACAFLTKAQPMDAIVETIHTHAAARHC